MPSLLIFATTLPSAVLTLATIILTTALNHNEPVTDTIQTWTCRWTDYAKSHGGLGSTQNDVPKNFGSMCTASVSIFSSVPQVFLFPKHSSCLFGSRKAILISHWIHSASNHHPPQSLGFSTHQIFTDVCIRYPAFHLLRLDSHLHPPALSAALLRRWRRCHAMYLEEEQVRWGIDANQGAAGKHGRLAGL